MSRPILTLSALLLALTGQPGLAQQPPESARKAKAVFEKYCHTCHGKDGAAEGGFGHVLDRERLVKAGTILPGEPDKSKLYKRLSGAKNPMPPFTDNDGNPITTRPSKEEIESVRAWLAAGAPDFDDARPARKFVRTAEVFASVVADLNRADDADRKYLRYLSIAHLHNAGLSDDELLAARHALAKLLNSLSWGGDVAVPEAIGPAKTIFRIDLRRYGWAERTWADIVAANRYDATLPSADAVRAARLAGAKVSPVIRADWFVEAASRPPLYHDILGLPANAGDLEEALLGVRAGRNIARNKVARAGFNGSGVSGNNRLIERHEIARGREWKAKGARWARASAYWKSYDFAGNTGQQNLFAYPLGPGGGANEFQHDGGEIIFNLPNGLQAYLLVDKDDRRIDEGPVKIVSDRRKNATSVTVVNGVSCMSCHAGGMIAKDDQVRDNVEKAVRDAFSRAEIVTVYTLYKPKAEFRALLDADAERFLAALKRTGAHGSQSEPVSALVGLFNREIDARLAASEVGMTEKTFLGRLEKSRGEVRRLFGPLLTGGTVKRDVMNRHFADLVAVVGAAE